MSQHQPTQRPELLAGYADGELTAADCATVDAWVAADAAARAELETQERLARKNVDLWQRLSPPLPDDAGWNRTLSGIKLGLQPATPSYRTSNRNPLPHRVWAVSAVAATVFVAVAIGLMTFRGDGIKSPALAADTLQIVHADDITIMSLQGDDDVIVIGRSPLTGPLDLVTVGDTELWATSTDLSETPSKPNIAPGDPNRRAWWNPADKLTPVP